MEKKVYSPELSAELYLEETPFDKKLIDFRFDTAKKYFYGDNCLELGPGSGHMTNLLEKYFDHITVIDASKTVLNNLKTKNSTEKVCSYFEEFDPVRTFDTIVMEHVLEHVDDPKLVLEKAKKWAHKNSIFIIGVPNSESLHRLAAVKMGLLDSSKQLNQRDLAYGHQRVFDKEELSKLLIDNGYQIIDFKGVFVKPLSNSQINEMWNESLINSYYLLSEKFADYCAEICFFCKLQK